MKRSQRPPRFEKLRQSKLTHSYRFDQNLADLLDYHFYKMGLNSSALEPTSILVIDCPPVVTAIWKNYENRGECAAIVRRVERWLNCNVEDKGTLAVLSPYKNQVKLLRDAMWANFSNHPDYLALDVLTVNKAQGREWDTVFYSASDTGRLQGNRPFLSDTSERKGKLVVNTAISRAKKHLRIFCDKGFWAQRQFPESLLTELSNQTTVMTDI